MHEIGYFLAFVSYAKSHAQLRATKQAVPNRAAIAAQSITRNPRKTDEGFTIVQRTVVVLAPSPVFLSDF